MQYTLLQKIFLCIPCFRDQKHHFLLQLISLVTGVEYTERREKKTTQQADFSVQHEDRAH